MSEVDDYVRVLQEWKQQPGKTITSVLTRVEQTKLFKGQELEDILRCITSFHKEIGKADEQLIDVKWYELCISAKKKLKRMQEMEEKQRKLHPALQKKTSNAISYPQQLTAGRASADERVLKFLYKSFVSHFDEGLTDSRTVPFIVAALKELKYKFDDRTDDVMNKRVISICTRLAKESCRQSKARMLEGEITAKDLAEDDEELYFDQKTRDNIKRIQREQVERNSGGYYDQMKRRINKDACEECRYCHKKAAYCEDQKQIRASDEPMTRFMRCNNCEKAWRD